MFPITVFYQLYGLADFSPLGYSTKLAESIGKMSSHLLETKCNEDGTDAGTNVIVSGGITITLPDKLNPALNLLVAQTSAPASHTRFTKTGYTPATPSLTGTVVYDGSVTGNWSISPYVALTIPMPIFMGGSGVSASSSYAFKQELGTDYPSFNMKRVFDDFSSFSETLTDPWYLVKRTSGTATASLSCQSLYNSDAVPGVLQTDCYLGLLVIATKGSTELIGVDDRVSEEGSVFLSYGANGFMHPVNGGPIKFKARLAPSAEFTGTDVSRMQVGLRGELGAKGVNFLNHYGVGFEVWSLANSAVITVLCAVPGVVTSIPTSIGLDTSRFTDLEIKISPFDKKAYFYVNSSLVHTQSLIYWPTNKEALLHPAISHSTYTLNERLLYVDYIYATQRINRG